MSSLIAYEFGNISSPFKSTNFIGRFLGKEFISVFFQSWSKFFDGNSDFRLCKIAVKDIKDYRNAMRIHL